MASNRDNKGNDNWYIKNNGKLVFTYKEAVSLGMSKKQFCKALDDLIAKGFLEITHQGTGPGEPSTYKLTERWQAYGTDHFKPAPPRRKNTSKDLGWPIYNSRKQKLSVDKDTSSSVDKDTSSIIKPKKQVLKKTPEYVAINALYD